MPEEMLTPDQGLLEKYRAALERIAQYNCHPYIEPDPAAVAESAACPDCKREREAEWALSPRVCDKHYRSLFSERERKQHHAEMCVKFEMKDIAREVLR